MSESKKITYEVVHHIPGRIRLMVPIIKSLKVKDLKNLSGFSLPSGIEDIRLNPFSGSIVIKYDPKAIDILAYIKEFLTSKEIETILKALQTYNKDL
jgi:hypothetical protein